MAPVDAREKFRGYGAELLGPTPRVARVEDRQTSGGIELRIYSSSDVSGAALPALMYFHGGGWVIGDLDTHDALCRKLALETGCVVVAVNYGLSPENKFPGPLNDCYQATKFIFDLSLIHI